MTNPECVFRLPSTDGKHLVEIADALILSPAGTCIIAAPVIAPPDFRALCYELVSQMNAMDDARNWDEDLFRRALAALNTPRSLTDGRPLKHGLAPVRQPLAPIPVAERLPGADDCRPNPRNGQGQWCWGLTGTVPGIPYSGSWRMMPLTAIVDEAFYWLPHWAIPLPEES